MRIFVGHNFWSNRGQVPLLRFLSNIVENGGIFWENGAQKFLTQTESFHIACRLVHKLRLLVVAKIVVANEGIHAKVVGQMNSTFFKRLHKKLIANSNSAIHDKVHFQNLLLFVINDALVLIFAKMARFQPKGHIVQKFGVLILNWIEKEAEIVEDVIEEIVHQNSMFDRLRQPHDKITVFLDMSQAIVLPIVLEVFVYLAVE